MKDDRANEITEAQDLVNRAFYLFDIGKCYKEIFPEHWQSSEASFAEKEREFYNLSTLEYEFFTLIDQRLFPCIDACDFDLELDGLFSIPVMPLQPYDWYDGDNDFDEIEPVWQLASALNYMMGYYKHLEISANVPSYWEDTYQQLKARYDLEVLPKKIDWSQLRNLCLKEKSPLKHLYNLFCCVDYSTGNLWLDFSHSMEDAECEWTPDNIRMLAQQFGEAEDILSGIADLNRWLEQEPTANMTAAIKFWNKATKRKYKDAGKPLIEILV